MNLKVKFTLEQATKAQTERRRIALLFFNLGATPRPLRPRERRGTYCIEGWVCPKAGLAGCGKPRPHRVRSPDHPDSSAVAIPSALLRPTGSIVT